MLKLITTEDFGWDEQAVSLFRPYSRGIEHPAGVKVASALAAELDALVPDKNETLVHTLAVGSTERYGPNRNGDGFRREENKLAHDRFVKNGHVFKHHQNKDPAKAVGTIKLSAYSDEMDRIELVIGLDNDKCRDEIHRAAQGKDLPGSMGCKVAFDVCSICKHKAPSPKSYCEHAKYAMTSIMDDGRQVYVDNPDPGYFDWSLVGRPADRIAFGTTIKTAAFDDHFVFSTELAKYAGLIVPACFADECRTEDKLAALGKLAEIEKEIEGTLTPLSVDGDLCGGLPMAGELSDEDAKKLKDAGIGPAMAALHAAKVLLPLKDFLKLVSADREDLSDMADDVEDQLPGAFSDLIEDGDPGDLFDGVGELPPGLGPILDRVSDAFGMGDIPLGRRVTVTIIRGTPAPKRRAKTAADDEVARGIARLYTQYKLAVVAHPSNQADQALLRAAVLQNYYST